MSTPEDAFRASIITWIEPARQNFLEKGQYEAVAVQTRDLAAETDSSRFLSVPAVQFVLDATFDVLSQPEVGEIFSTVEVSERAEIASQVAGFVTKVAVDEDIFSEFYLTDSYITKSIDVGRMITLGRIISDYKKALTKLANAPFRDVGWVAGGALRLLEDYSIEEDPQEVLMKSRGLLIIAGIHKDFADEAREILGLTYINPNNLRRAKKEGHSEVTFTDDAKKQIERFYKERSGCPAWQIRRVLDIEESLLSEYFGKLVHYLVPPGATASLT